MRKAPPLAPIVLAALCAMAAGCGGSQAACGADAPDLEASPAQASPNKPFRLHGEGFFGDFICDDTGPLTLFRSAGGRATDGIQVEFLQGTKAWTLATVSSDEDLAFDAGGIIVPADAAPGKAVVRATSPSVLPEVFPPRAETPFLVLDDPETGSLGEAGGK